MFMNIHNFFCRKYGAVCRDNLLKPLASIFMSYSRYANRVLAIVKTSVRLSACVSVTLLTLLHHQSAAS